MKKYIFLTALLFGLITQRSDAQCTNAGNGYLFGRYLGFAGPGGNLPFATNGVPQMTLTTGGQLGIGTSAPGYLIDVNGGDVNVGPASSTVGYRIAGGFVLRNNSNPANIFVGVDAGNGTTGSNNTAVGNEALFLNTTLKGNTAIGDSALYNLNTASAISTNNLAIGNSALYLTNGAAAGSADNTGVGEFAMRYNTSGISNTAAGFASLYSSSTASGNTAIGKFAGYTNIASYNTFLGDSAGWNNGGSVNNNENTYVGYNAGDDASFIGVNNSTWVGFNSGPGIPGSNFVYLGNGSTTWIESFNGIFTTWSDRRIKNNIKENVPGLDFITKLHPVTYNIDVDKENELLGVKDDKNWDGKYDVEKITQSGFIAQQVDSAARSCGYDFSGVVKPKTSNGAYALGYTIFVVPLVKSVQELNIKNEALNSTVDSLRKVLQSIQSCLNQICSATGNPTGDLGSSAATQNVTLSSTNTPLLYQNSPNPFKSGTKINYYLPEGTIGASIVFYDNYGNQIKTLQISQTGNGTLNITPDNLTNGIYSYSLLVNGSVIDTKRMVLQK